MGPLLKFTSAIDTLSEWLGEISKYVVIITVVVGFLNVVLRYVGQFVGQKLTNNSIIELQWYLYSLIFFFGFAYILKHNINVRVDFWYAEQPLKRRAWINLIGHLVALIPFCLLALYVTWQPVMRSWGLLPNGTWGTWEVSPDPNGLPRAPIKSMILVAFATLLLQGIAEVIKLVAIIRGVEVEIEEAEAPIRVE